MKEKSRLLGGTWTNLKIHLMNATVQCNKNVTD